MILYHYLEPRWALKDLKEQQMRGSRYTNLNDPQELRMVNLCFEGYDLAPDAIPRLYDRYRNEMIVCFSESWNIPRMWEKYGVSESRFSHGGVCLRLKVLPVEGGKQLLEKVKYSASKQTVTIPRALGDAFKSQDVKRIDHALVDRLEPYIMRLFCTKERRWSYEREWRAFVHRTDEQDFVAWGKVIEPISLILGRRCKTPLSLVKESLAAYNGTVQVHRIVGNGLRRVEGI